jgi:hypothetical protein
VPAEETPAFGGIAERFRRGGDLDRAIALCRDGLKRFPDQLSARVTLGWSLLDKGQYDLARTELEQVLRKAPDNLAAIRGLAELHDRTEGTIAAEDERAWRSNDAAAASAVESATVAAGPSPASDRAPTTEVSFGDAGADVLHTAAYAQQIADAATPDFGTASITAVEIEAPAAASMAAADPAPFFVVAPVETQFDPGSSAETTVPVPFDALTVDAVVEPVEIETPGAAALSAFAATGGLDPEIQTESPDVSFDDAELSELTAQALKAGDIDIVDRTEPEIRTAVPDSTSPWQADVHEEMSAQPTLSDIGGGELPGGELEALLGVETGADGLLDAPFADAQTRFKAPEGLDDIDENAGQELADAIKALEDATRRVEARLAPLPTRTEPATAPEEIGSYDFGLDPESAAADDARHEGPVPVDARQDGSFQLVAPDLSDASFGPDAADEVEDTAGTETLQLLTADASAPAFDFDAVASDERTTDDSLSAAETGEQAFEALATDLAAPADIVEVVTADAVEPIGIVAEAAVVDVDDVDEQALADALAAVLDEQEAEEDLAAAAMAATDPVEPSVIVDKGIDNALAAYALAGRASDATPSKVAPALVPDPEPVPIVHVYDAPVFIASATEAVGAEISALVEAPLPLMELVQTPVRSQLAALERFLRKVQARQLELRGETVA